MKDFFKFEENKTTYKREILAGVISFATISYLIFLIPLIFSKNLGISNDAMFFSVIISGVIATLIAGIYSNIPVVMLCGVGPMAWFIFGIVLSNHFSFVEALFASFLSGIMMLIVSVTNFRSKVIQSIPTSLKYAFVSGIGLFIIVLGLKQSHVIVVEPNTLAKIVIKDNLGFYYTLASLFILIILDRLKFSGGFIIVLILSVIINLINGGVNFHESNLFAPPVIDDSNFFKLDFKGIFNVSLLVMALITFLSNFLDATGTFMSVAKAVGKDYDSKEFKRGLIADSIGVSISSLCGVSPTVTTLESHAGIHAGGRTGFVSVVVAILLLLSLFLYPILKLIPAWGSGPILLYIGFSMFKELFNIDHKDDLIIIPCILAIIIPGLTFSIPNGFGLAILYYLVIGLLFKKIKIRESVPLIILLLIYLLYLYV